MAAKVMVKTILNKILRKPGLIRNDAPITQKALSSSLKTIVSVQELQTCFPALELERHVAGLGAINILFKNLAALFTAYPIDNIALSSSILKTLGGKDNVAYEFSQRQILAHEYITNIRDEYFIYMNSDYYQISFNTTPANKYGLPHDYYLRFNKISRENMEQKIRSVTYYYFD